VRHARLTLHVVCQCTKIYVSSFNRWKSILGGPKSKNASRDHDLAAFWGWFRLSFVMINLHTTFEVCNSTRYEDMNGDDNNNNDRLTAFDPGQPG